MSSGRTASRPPTVTIEQLLLSEGLCRRLDDLAARRRLERADPAGRTRGGLRGGSRAVSAPPRRSSRRRSSRPSPRPRSLRSRTRPSTSPSSRRGSAAATTRRTCCARASCCSRTSGSSTPTCSATRSRRSRPRSSPSRRPARSSSFPDGTYAHLVPGATRSFSAAHARPPRRSSATRSRPHRSSRCPAASSDAAGEVRDGAHNPDGARHLVESARRRRLHRRRLDPRRQGRRRDASPRFVVLGRRFVATRSSSARALPAAELAELARAHFDHVEVVDDPVAAVARAHELGEPVLVTGSLYLLGDLAQAE